MEMKHDDLERQMIRGQIKTHTTLSDISKRINEIESVVYGINDALIEKGIVSSKFLFQKIERFKTKMRESGELADAGTTLRVDDEEVKESEIDCVVRLPVCKAVCCKLSFPLTAEEVEGGELKWDLGKPYYIRQNKDGYCCNKGKENNCTIYDKRPSVCRAYSCEGDERIWKDFDNMVLNEEWINANLTGGVPS